MKLHLAAPTRGETRAEGRRSPRCRPTRTRRSRTCATWRAASTRRCSPSRASIAALEAQARKSAVSVAIESDGVARYSEDVEAAVYFCCLEALQNVAKYAGAATALVRLGETDGQLHFAVADDGAGFDPAATARGSGLQNMADRVEALGGTLEVTSTPGDGTAVTGSVPARRPR